MREPGFYGAVNVATGAAILFAPRFSAEYATWMGKLWTCDDFKNRYGADEVRFVDEVIINNSNGCVTLDMSPFQIKI